MLHMKNPSNTNTGLGSSIIALDSGITEGFENHLALEIALVKDKFEMTRFLQNFSSPQPSTGLFKVSWMVYYCKWTIGHLMTKPLN